MKNLTEGHGGMERKNYKQIFKAIVGEHVDNGYKSTIKCTGINDYGFALTNEGGKYGDFYLAVDFNPENESWTIGRNSRRDSFGNLDTNDLVEKRGEGIVNLINKLALILDFNQYAIIRKFKLEESPGHSAPTCLDGNHG